MDNIKDFIAKELDADMDTKIAGANEMSKMMYRGKMYTLISDYIREVITTLMEEEKEGGINITLDLMKFTDSAIVRAVKIIFKEDLEVRESVRNDNRYIGFYLDDTLIFEYGYGDESKHQKI